ncbi:hypothetical protein M885DRAFT_57295 [Pelagophyceae sp. CCMP2097]|nr:hypothetical protein M885DRAFT_57295 [Pelagophyceae sp. CCMP2097]
MGFPVDWAIRAAEHCDVTLNESLAIAWIIERMSDETAQNEEGFGAGGYGDADDYGDDGDDAADLRVAESRDGAPGYGGRVLDDYYNRGTTALSEDKVDVSAALRGDEEGEESSGQVDLDGKRRSAVEYDFEGDSLSTFDSLYAAIALPRLSLAPLVEQRAQAPRHAGLSNNDDASFCAEDAAGPADAATAPRLATSWTEADGAAGVTAGGASAGDASVDYSELPASARRPTALEALGTNASDDEIVVVCFLAEAALAVLWARSACVNVLHHAASTESFPANVSQAESQTLNLVSLLRLTVVLGDSVKSIGHEARALATPAQWHALLDAPGVLVSRGRPSMLAPAFRARTSLDPSVTVEAQFGEMLGLGNLDAVKMVRAVLEKVEGPLLEALLETAMIDFDRARHRDHNAARWCGNADARTDADALGAKRPNVAWAAAVLTALMARAEVVASEEDDDNESEGETPAEHETPAPLRREGSQVVLRVFSPGLLGTLLNASASPNLHLKRLSLDLASRVLRFARLHARRKMTASVVSPAAKHRLRGLLRAASPRLHDGAARSAPHSPDVVALFSTCLEWRALEVDLAFADDGPQQVDVLASEGKAEYQLTLEDVSSDCIAVSWGGWDYTEAPPRAVAAKETAKVNLGVENLGVENLGVENLVLEARPVAFKSGASRPFEACGGALARRGCFVVDGLKSDSRYQLRLCAFDAGRRVYTGPLMAAATAAEALYQLDPAACGPNLVLSNGGATVTNRLNKKWNACRAAVGFSTGVRCWEVRIERCCSKNIFIGVQRAEATLENYVGADRYGWGYLAGHPRRRSVGSEEALNPSNEMHTKRKTLQLARLATHHGDSSWRLIMATHHGDSSWRLKSWPFSKPRVHPEYTTSGLGESRSLEQQGQSPVLRRALPRRRRGRRPAGLRRRRAQFHSQRAASRRGRLRAGRRALPRLLPLQQRRPTHDRSPRRRVAGPRRGSGEPARGQSVRRRVLERLWRRPGRRARRRRSELPPTR